MGLPVRRGIPLLGLALGCSSPDVATPPAYAAPSRLEWVDPARCLAPCAGPDADALVVIDAEGRPASSGVLRFSREAAPALGDLIAAAARDGFALKVVSPYRTYDEQAAVFAGAGDVGRAARPGHSEHELGEAVDLDAAPEGYGWLDANAARFGFVESFPARSEKTTGYVHEWWHFRYVGARVAGEVGRYGTLEAWFAAHPDRAVSGDCADCPGDAARAACGAETAAGRCDKSVLVWCFDGALDAVDCAKSALACGSDAAGSDCRP